MLHAAAGHTVTGLDPARASLQAARAKPGAEHVTWVEGTSPVLPDASFDVAVMTSHVAQEVAGTATLRFRTEGEVRSAGRAGAGSGLSV